MGKPGKVVCLWWSKVFPTFLARASLSQSKHSLCGHPFVPCALAQRDLIEAKGALFGWGGVDALGLLWDVAFLLLGLCVSLKKARAGVAGQAFLSNAESLRLPGGRRRQKSLNCTDALWIWRGPILAFEVGWMVAVSLSSCPPIS